MSGFEPRRSQTVSELDADWTVCQVGIDLYPEKQPNSIVNFQLSFPYEAMNDAGAYYMLCDFGLRVSLRADVART